MSSSTTWSAGGAPTDCGSAPAESPYLKRGKAGDGTLWITDVERVIRIRTGERGVDALH